VGVERCPDFSITCDWFWIQRDELGALVSLEMGKIKTEGVGEVQEFVDIVRISMSIIIPLSILSASSAITPLVYLE
jgi:hypothetical protein